MPPGRRIHTGPGARGATTTGGTTTTGGATTTGGVSATGLTPAEKGRTERIFKNLQRDLMSSSTQAEIENKLDRAISSLSSYSSLVAFKNEVMRIKSNFQSDVSRGYAVDVAKGASLRSVSNLISIITGVSAVASTTGGTATRGAKREKGRLKQIWEGFKIFTNPNLSVCEITNQLTAMIEKNDTVRTYVENIEKKIGLRK